MRLKLFSAFLALQFLSFGVYQHISADAVHADITHTHDHSEVEELAKSGVRPVSATNNLRFSARNMNETSKFVNSIRQNQIQTALAKLPADHAKATDRIILDYSPQAHRGLAGGGIIILRAVNMSSEEFVGVLIHEAAHNVDFNFLTPPVTKQKSGFMDGNEFIYASDPSLQFYRISWLSNTKRKSRASNQDFVSGYAMSNPFEDFAESYAYYVLHNKDFKAKTAESDALLAKYNFIKYKVFGGQEFDSGDGVVKPNNRPWDTTVLSFDLNEFMS